MERVFLSKNIEDTINLGKMLAKTLPNGVCVLLNGDLGSGKTTLVRGVALGLNIKDKVQSPTFNIMKIYFKADRPLIHIDAYRLADANLDIGLDEYIGYETGLTFIEWPMYVESLLPDDCLNIRIENLSENERKFTFKAKEEILKDLF